MARPSKSNRAGVFANDPALREKALSVAAAIDEVLPVLERLLVGLAKRKEAPALRLTASALQALAVLRECMTNAAAKDGFALPLSPVAEDVMQVLVSHAQADARAQLALNSPVGRAVRKGAK